MVEGIAVNQVNIGLIGVKERLDAVAAWCAEVTTDWRALVARRDIDVRVYGEGHVMEKQGGRYEDTFAAIGRLACGTLVEMKTAAGRWPSPWPSSSRSGPDGPYL